jgi:hypothetical protein
MSKIANLIKDVAPLADPPAYLFLLKKADEINGQLSNAAALKSKRGGIGLYASLERHAPDVWDEAVWHACSMFGPDAVRVAGRCLKKRGLLGFLPKVRQRSSFEVLDGGKK